MKKKKIIITIDQLFTAIKTSNKVHYPLEFKRPEDFESFIRFLEEEGLK